MRSVAGASRSPASDGLPTQLVIGVPLAVIFGLFAQRSVAVSIALIVGAAALATVAWISFARPVVFAAILTVGFCFQPMLKFFVSLYLGPAKDALVVSAVAGLIVARIFRLNARDGRSDVRVQILAGLFIAVYVINVAGNHGSGWSAASRLAIEGIALLVVGYESPFSSGDWLGIVRVVRIIGVVEAVLGFVQQALGTGRLVTGLGYSFGEQVRQTTGGQLRSFGSFDDPFSYAAFMLLAFVVVTQSAPRARSTMWCAPVIALGVVASYARTDMVLLLIAALWWAGRLFGGRLIAVLGTAAGAAMGALLTAVPHVTGSKLTPSFLLTLNGRVDLWGNIIGTPWNLLAGRGAGVVGTGLARSHSSLIAVQQRYVPGQIPAVADLGNLSSVDNSYLAIIADVGFVGLAPILVLLALLGAKGVVVSNQHPGGLALVGIIAVLALDGVTRSSLFSFPFGYVALYLAGAAAASLRNAEQATR